MLLVVVSKGTFVELRCILHTPDESKLLREKEDYVVLDLANYHTCNDQPWQKGFVNQILPGKKENKLFGKK
jgi:hypothetical protein